jgi:hypothetical protein
MEKYDFKSDATEKALFFNKHNHATTTYYLLMKKLEREIEEDEDSDEKVEHNNTMPETGRRGGEKNDESVLDQPKHGNYARTKYPP